MFSNILSHFYFEPPIIVPAAETAILTLISWSWGCVSGGQCYQVLCLSHTASLKSKWIFWSQGCHCSHDRSALLFVAMWRVCGRNAVLRPFSLPSLTKFSPILHTWAHTYTHRHTQTYRLNLSPFSLTTYTRIPNSRMLPLPHTCYSQTRQPAGNSLSLVYAVLHPGWSTDSFKAWIESHLFQAPSLDNPTLCCSPSWIRRTRVEENVGGTQHHKTHLLKLIKSLPHQEALIHEWEHQPCPVSFTRLLLVTNETIHQEKTIRQAHNCVHYTIVTLAMRNRK